DRVSALRSFRLLDDRHHATAADLGYPEALGVGHFLQDDARATRLAGEAAHRGHDRALDDVVAEHDADAVPFREFLRQREGRRDAAFTFLVSVVQPLEAEILAVAEKP